MSMYTYMGGPPRVDAERLAIRRTIALGQPPLLYGSKKIVVNGLKTRDPGNTPTDAIRPGTLLGKISATGLYAPSVIGISQNAYTSGGTSITLTPAQAVYLVSRIGQSGNLAFIGPPAAAGTVAVINPIAFSAVNVSTGVVTVSTLGVNLIAGGLVADTDGSHIPIFPLIETDGIKMTDISGTSQDQPSWPCVGGGLRWGAMLPLVTDTSLITWVKAQLRIDGLFQFDTDF